MLCLKSTSRLAAAVLGITLIAGEANAAEISPLRVELRNEASSGVEQIRRAYITSGTNVLSFTLPAGFQMDASKPGKVVFVNADYSCFMTFSIVAPRTGEMKPGFCRGLAKRWQPSAKTSDEFPQAAGMYAATACDLEWANPSGSLQSARVAYVSAAAGVLQFTLLTQPDKFREGQNSFNFLVWSCQSNEGGKLQIATVRSAPES